MPVQDLMIGSSALIFTRAVSSVSPHFLGSLVHNCGYAPLLGLPDSPSRDRALEILEERFARGEIDHDEFEARRRTLRGK